MGNAGPSYQKFNLHLILSVGSSTAAYAATGGFATDYTTYTAGAWVLNDPAVAFNVSGSAADMRFLTGCITFRDIGKLLDIQGEVCHLTNLSSELLEEEHSSAPSIDQLFDLGTKLERVTQNTREHKIIAHPDAKFFDKDSGAYMITGTDNGKTEEMKTMNYGIHGIAWRGVDPEKLSLAIDITKNVEWRPKYSAGMTNEPLHDSGKGTNVHRVNKWAETLGGVDWATVGESAYRAYRAYNAFSGRAGARLTYS
jgi:hypothetical protein